MKPYMLIEGTNQAIEAFENKVSQALELGYNLAGELVAHTVSPSEVKFYQPVMWLDEMDEDEEEEDYEDEEEEEVN